jgi:hypothetical protein
LAALMFEYASKFRDRRRAVFGGVRDRIG